MRAKTRCIISILLILLPVVPVVCSLVGKLLYAYDRTAGSAVLGILVPFGEMSGLLYYTAYPVVCAVAAIGMHCFGEDDLPKTLERLLLLFPIAAGVCGLLLIVLLLFGFGPWALFVGLAAAYLGWLVCNIAALCVLHRETRAERKT